MLMTDDVDEDYFTPAPNTSLANIFENHTEDTEMIENESLKYTPPKKSNSIDVFPITEQKTEEESKATECVYACALTAHEWEHGRFAARGLLGFAILKITKTNCHNIVLYDSKKLTLSSAPVTSKLKVIYKTDSKFLSYYDSLNKYWSLHGKPSEIEKIIEILTNLEVSVTYETPKDNQENPEDKQPVMNKQSEEKDGEQEMHSEKESDTDSSVKRKTKASILNRMARMGHSVLPPNPTSHTDRSSESSDSNEFIPTYNQLSKIRTKPKQSLTKRAYLDSETLDNHRMPIANFDQSSNLTNLYTIVNGQLVPAANFNESSTDVNLFMSEQRMSNNEIRININRTTDKVDQVLDKLKCLEQAVGDRNILKFQIDIMQKLLLEYEIKINKLEDMLKSKEQNNEGSITDASNTTLKLCEENNTKLFKLQELLKDREKEITELKRKQDECEILKEKEIKYLKTTITSKNDEIDKLKSQINEQNKNAIYPNGELEAKIKNVMNEVFTIISANYEDAETYTGQQVKKTIASVIRNTTLKYCNKNK